jgi:hypothetical protein
MTKFQFLAGAQIFLFAITSIPALEPIQPLSWAASLGVKWLEHEADHLPPCSVWCGALYPLPVLLHGMVLKLRDNMYVHDYIFFPVL